MDKLTGNIQNQKLGLCNDRIKEGCTSELTVQK